MAICHLMALPNLPSLTHVIGRNQVLKKAAGLPKACDGVRWGGKKQRPERQCPPRLSDKHKAATRVRMPGPQAELTRLPSHLTVTG